MSPEDRATLVTEVVAALKDSHHPASALSDEEQLWVRLAIKKEAQSIALRRAIIEKSLSGLVWAGVVAVGYGIKEAAILLLAAKGIDLGPKP